MERFFGCCVKQALGVSVIAAFAATAAFAADACKEDMGHTGSGHTISNNQTGSIAGTPWGFEQWSGGGNQSMTYYDNGTFKANWSNNQDYLARVGFRYGDNGAGVDHKTKHYTVDYKYTKTGTAQYGYIGVYGWTVNPQVEYYIVDDWYSKPNENYIGKKFGEITVDGATYTIHAYLRQREPSKTGTSTFLQIFSVRQTARQCGHIDISAHFNKWDELFTGQTAQLNGSKGGGSTTLKFGKVTEVMLMNEAGGNATGSVDYTYFYMSDTGEGSEVTTPPKEIERRPFGGTAAVIPGIVEAENFDEGNNGVSYGGATGSSGDNGDKNYRGEDYPTVDIVGAGTGKAIGYTASGEWLEYTVEVAAAGEYTVEGVVSNGSSAGTLTLKVDNVKVGTLSFEKTADWDSYTTVSTKVDLKKGKQVLRIEIDNDNTNVDKLVFKSQEPQSIKLASRANTLSGNVSVFDMQGRFIGNVNLMSKANVANAIFAKFNKVGIYMVKQGSSLIQVRVNQ